MGYLEGSLEVLRRLAQEYGIDFDKGTDPVGVLQELQRRAGSSGMGPTGGIFKELKRGIQSIPRKSRPLTQEVRYNAHRYRIWAVLIGIDAYEQYPLHGCVSDALLMQRFLTGDLGVPDNRIQCLLGPRDTNSTDPKSTPSHTNIIDTLYSLADNPQIERGDNIIIYYAGHAGTSCCTAHDRIFQCNDSCCIEALCPIDSGIRDADGSGISDRELNFLFALICRAKGHNITFIVDAHYWGRLGRGQLPRVGMVRPSSEANSMLHAADERYGLTRNSGSRLFRGWAQRGRKLWGNVYRCAPSCFEVD
ncbi:hypothetical protein F5146DRAFT_610630 [Armillaria mellea]|nr:hypothetical protein F5146DRAFT_610630 [Armillaria mellea]